MLDSKQRMPMQVTKAPFRPHAPLVDHSRGLARTSYGFRTQVDLHWQFTDGSTPLVWRVCVYAGAELAHPELPRTLPANANYFEKVWSPPEYPREYSRVPP
jgi:hypothetical protein